MTLELSYDYKTCVENSEKITWALDDVFPVGTRLDFERPFLPESLAPTHGLAFLPGHEQRALNQIAGNAYLNLFAFVEEYILATIVQLTQAELFGDHMAIRALVRFVDEEVKHQQLFARFRDAFDRDFGVPCEVLGSAAEVAGVIMQKSPIAVMLMTLHIELMTQQHYTESVRDDHGVDPLFSKMLKHHWLEESQHARIDALELKKLVDPATPAQVTTATTDYLDLLDAVNGLLQHQAEMDVRSMELKHHRSFTAEERKAIVHNQHRGYVATFITAGMTHPMFVDIMGKIDPAAAARVSDKARAFA